MRFTRICSECCGTSHAIRLNESEWNHCGGAKRLLAEWWKSTPIENWTSYAVNDPLLTTLSDAVAFLAGHAVRYALIGGLAASFRGQTRVTADVDMVIATDIESALQLLADVGQSKFAPLFADAAEVVKKAFLLPLKHRETGVKVDLALGLSGFERQAIQRAERVEWEGCQVMMATCEDLIIMKILAGRPHDDQDVRGIVNTRRDELDWEYCLQTARELGEAVGQDLLRQVQSLRDDRTLNDE